VKARETNEEDCDYWSGDSFALNVCLIFVIGHSLTGTKTVFCKTFVTLE